MANIEVKCGEFIKKRFEELESIKSGVYANENLLAKNWLSKEDNEAWKNL